MWEICVCSGLYQIHIPQGFKLGLYGISWGLICNRKEAAKRIRGRFRQQGRNRLSHYGSRGTGTRRMRQQMDLVLPKAFAQAGMAPLRPLVMVSITVSLLPPYPDGVGQIRSAHGGIAATFRTMTGGALDAALTGVSQFLVGVGQLATGQGQDVVGHFLHARAPSTEPHAGILVPPSTAGRPLVMVSMS